MPISNAERQRKFKIDMTAKGYKQIYGLWAPDDAGLRDKIRKSAEDLITEHNSKKPKGGK